MSYAERFSQTHKLNFQDAARMALAVNESRLRHTVTEMPQSGEQSAVVLYYDKVEATEREGRGATIADNPAQRRRRWLKYRPSMTSGELIDSNDKFQGMTDFQSALMKAHTGAIKRKIDRDRILEGILGDGFEGELGGTAIALPSTQLIGVTVKSGSGTSAVGMNLAKIKASRKLFAANDWDLDMETPFLLLTAEQIDDLSDEIQLTSSDYRQEAGPQFSRDGKLSMVWNHFIIEHQALPTKVVGSDTVQRNVAYMKSAIGLGVWKDVTFDTAIQPQMYNELYMWAEANMDCRRLDEKGVNEIESKIG